MKINPTLTPDRTIQGQALNPLPEGEETIILPPFQGEGRGGDGVMKVFSEQREINL